LSQWGHFADKGGQLFAIFVQTFFMDGPTEDAFCQNKNKICQNLGLYLAR